MDAALREQMPACAEDVVNTLTTWTHDHPDADFDTREALVLEQGCSLLRELLGLVAAVAGPRTPACPRCRRAVGRCRWSDVPRAEPAGELSSRRGDPRARPQLGEDVG